MGEKSNNYLIHYGVLGMKWGVRKDNYTYGYIPKGKRKRDITKKNWSSTKVRKKEDKLLKSKKNNNTKSVNDKIQKEVKNSKIYKKYKDSERKADKAFDKGSDNWFDLDMKVHDLAEKVNDHMYKVSDKYANEYASAMLKDLKYADTESGREWIKKKLGIG